MPNLKRLTMLNHPDLDPRYTEDILSNIDWLQQACPTLEYFAWYVASSHYRPGNPFPATEIERFLTTNSGIKFVSLRLDTKENLKILMASDIPVNELFFSMTGNCFDDIPVIIGDLKDFCEKQKTTKNVEQTRLHLQAYGSEFEEHSGQLELLAPYIVGLYFRCYVGRISATVFSKFINLKVLQVTEDVPAELLCSLPNVEEIYIWCKHRPLSYYEHEIRVLASRLPKLETLFLNNYIHRCFEHCMDVEEDFFDDEKFEFFAEIDVERKKMLGVKKLRVYVEVSQNLVEVTTDYDTIGITGSQQEAITNPFIQQTHLANSVAAPNNCVIL